MQHGKDSKPVSYLHCTKKYCKYYTRERVNLSSSSSVVLLGCPAAGDDCALDGLHTHRPPVLCTQTTRDTRLVHDLAPVLASGSPPHPGTVLSHASKKVVLLTNVLVVIVRGYGGPGVGATVWVLCDAREGHRLLHDANARYWN